MASAIQTVSLYAVGEAVVFRRTFNVEVGDWFVATNVIDDENEPDIEEETKENEC